MTSITDEWTTFANPPLKRARLLVVTSNDSEADVATCRGEEGPVKNLRVHRRGKACYFFRSIATKPLDILLLTSRTARQVKLASPEHCSN